MTRLRILIFALLLVVTSCISNDWEDFSLVVNHYGGGAGITIIYSIDEKGLQVDTNCDLANCKQATVYTRTFTKSESDSIFHVLQSYKLDTLKKLYKYQGYYDDGFYTVVKLKQGLFSSTKSTFENIYTPTADTLFSFIDNLVTENKYKLAKWGQDE